MHHVIDTIKGSVKAVLVAYIANKETYARITLELLGHFPLLHLITGVNDDPTGVVLGLNHGHENIAERARAPRHRNGCIVEHLLLIPEQQNNRSRFQPDMFITHMRSIDRKLAKATLSFENQLVCNRHAQSDAEGK